MHSAGSAGDKSKRMRIPSAKARSESAAAGKHAAAASEDVKAIKEAESPTPVKQPFAEKPSHGEETEGTGAAASSPRSPVTLEIDPKCAHTYASTDVLEQVQGYGALMMNRLKQYAIGMGSTHILTYADERALGYFRKQGFKRAIDMAEDRYLGYVKDYEKALLMSCYLHPSMPFTQVKHVMIHQRDFILSRIQQHEQLTGQHAHEYPGIDDIDQSNDDTKPNSAANNQFKITYPYGEIPGIKEAG
eukprot:20992-Heterococcus_DN1.PRE.1